MKTEFFPTCQVPNISDDDYKLYKAAKEGNANLVKSIITANLNLSLDAHFIDSPNSFHPILFAAILSGSTKTVELLIDAGATIDLTNEANNTALDFAILEDREAIAWLLITKGASASSLLHTEHISQALYFKDTRILSHLLDQHPDLNNQQDIDLPYFSNPLTIALSCASTDGLKTMAMHPFVKLINIHDSFNILSFIIIKAKACPAKLKLIMDCIRQRYGQDKLTKELNRPSNVCGLNHELLYTPINLVCSQSLRVTSSQRLDLIRLLTSNGADLNYVRDKESRIHARAVRGSSNLVGAISPLMECVKMGDMDCAKFLILHGARATAQEALDCLQNSNDTWLFKMMVAGEESLVEISRMPAVEEVTFQNEEAKQTYSQWTGQVKSLQHLIRAKWLKSDQLNKEQEIYKAEIPQTLKDYLLLQRPGQL